jgi:photosystem II stability/assembly factor-like uncharacterized protein
MKKNLLLIGILMSIAFISNAQWTEQASGFSVASRGINNIYAIDENVVWATAYDGTGGTAKIQEFTKTTNGGTLWTPGTISGVSDLTIAMICAIDGDVAWAPLWGDTNRGIYKTTNGGGAWTRQTTAEFAGSAGFPNIVHFWNANEGMCIGDPNGGYFEIYTTTNGGDTWTRVSESNIPNEQSGEAGWTSVYEVVGDVVWFGTNKGRLYKSTNKGATWTVITTPLSDINKIEFKDENNGIVASYNVPESNFNIYKTSNGGTDWQQVTPGGTGVLYGSDICYVPGTPDAYISSGAKEEAHGISYSLDGCATWTTYTDTMQFLQMDFVNNTIGWVGQFNVDDVVGGMYKYTGGPVGLVDMLSRNKSFNIYPNPCNSSFNIYINELKNKEIIINIYDLLGKKVFSSNENNLSSYHHKTINTSELKKGIYIVYIQSGSETHQEKLIIQ